MSIRSNEDYKARRREARNRNMAAKALRDREKPFHQRRVEAKRQEPRKVSLREAEAEAYWARELE